MIRRIGSDGQRDSILVGFLRCDDIITVVKLVFGHIVITNCLPKVSGTSEEPAQVTSDDEVCISFQCIPFYSLS